MTKPPEDPKLFTPESAFRKSPPRPGCGDIWCAGPTFVERVGECAALLLFTFTDEGPVFSSVRLITPPGGPARDEIKAAIVATILRHRADATPEEVDSHVSGRLKVLEAQSLDGACVLPLLEFRRARPHAVIITEAARFRFGATGASPEQIWAANLSALAGRACEEAIANAGYVLLDAGQPPPLDAAAIALLMNAHDECGVVMAGTADEGRTERIARAQEIEALSDADRFGEALAAIDALDLEPSARLGMRAGVFLKAGLHPQAVEALQEVRRLGATSPVAADLQYARLSQQARNVGLAAHFLRGALDRATMVEDLEAGLTVANLIDDEEILKGAADRLKALFPASRVLLAYNLDEAVLRGDFREAAGLLAGVPEQEAQSRFYADVARSLHSKPAEYEALDRTLSARWPAFSNQAGRALVIDAQKRGRHYEAVALLLARMEDLPSAETIRRLISVMRVLLLHDRRVNEEQVLAALSATVERTLDRLAHAPSDAPTRAMLGNLLSTEESGVMGRVVLGRVLASRIRLDPDATLPEPHRRPATPAELQAFEDASGAWMQQAHMLMTGRSQIPANLVPAGFHGGVVWHLVSLIADEAVDLDTPEGVEDFLRFVTLVAGFATHLQGSDRDLDIQAIKLAATQLARANHHQRARDLIEVVLQVAGADPARVRAAWFAYGEIHRLAGDPEEAAIAIAAGASRAAPTTKSALWHETLDVIRLLRDRRERRTALAFIARARQTLEELDLVEDYGSRLETLRLQIEQLEVLSAQPIDSVRLKKLLDDAVANGRAVLEDGDQAGPCAALLAQTLRQARLEGLVPPEDADTVCGLLLGKLPAGAAQRLGRFFAEPTLEDLIALSRELEGARYGRNLVQDVGPLVMLARRYLAGEMLPSEGAVFAIELLADHGLLDRDEYGVETPGALPTAPEDVIEVARTLSSTGLAVALMGLDEQRRLVRVDVVDGIVGPAIVEPEKVFSRDRLAAWRQLFPYEYAFLDERRSADGRLLNSFQLMQEFDTSMDGIGVSGLPAQRVVVIPDAALADIPVNLLSVDGVFAAEQRVISTAPSLHWLAGAVGRRDRVHGPSYCWIPTSGARKKALLPQVAVDLAPILASAGIVLNQGAAMPPALEGAELAIVAAHGGLSTLEKKFFRRIADDASGVMPGDRLAEGLAGAKVAILFVCSGARLDMEPGGQATLGLARQLLDRGCSAVVGSPWPLRGDVPRRWLPAFLEAWAQDLPVADACNFANEAVRGFPDTHHALHVYGDPLVRRQGASASK